MTMSSFERRGAFAGYHSDAAAEMAATKAIVRSYMPAEMRPIGARRGYRRRREKAE
jgi:hypothetical protein